MVHPFTEIAKLQSLRWFVYARSFGDQGPKEATATGEDADGGMLPLVPD